MITGWIDLVNFSFASISLVVVCLGLFFAIKFPYIQSADRTFFEVFFSVLFLYVISDLISQLSLVWMGEGYVVLSKVSIFAESLASSILMPLLTVYLLICSGENWKKSSLLYFSVSLWGGYFGVLIVTQFTKHIYYFTSDNVYHRGPLYPMLLVPPALLMIINLIALFRRKKRLTSKVWRAFFVYLALPLVCMLVQMMVYGLLMILIGSSVSAFYMLVVLLIEQMENYVKTREELARQQANIAVLQMRPHFIYNTMSSIYYLCEQDSEKAKQMINYFTDYLRNNFHAIAKEGTIPFSNELEHVKAYLSIEHMRFEELLFVKYDIPNFMFQIPPLTLQPLVENAVKYGLDPERAPLTISISVRKEKGGIKVIVEDDGPGFDVDSWNDDDDREPHIALANIRERLQMMCKGTLSIESCAGEGARAEIWIPDIKE